jgi:hypothetical protein
MTGGHWHIGVDHIIVYGVSAIIVINLVRLIASAMVANGGTWETPGKVLGSLVHFGS